MELRLGAWMSEHGAEGLGLGTAVELGLTLLLLSLPTCEWSLRLWLPFCLWGPVSCVSPCACLCL